PSVADLAVPYGGFGRLTLAWTERETNLVFRTTPVVLINGNWGCPGPERLIAPDQLTSTGWATKTDLKDSNGMPHCRSSPTTKLLETNSQRRNYHARCHYRHSIRPNVGRQRAAPQGRRREHARHLPDARQSRVPARVDRGADELRRIGRRGLSPDLP